jgi:hypothetical protein
LTVNLGLLLLEQGDADGARPHLEESVRVNRRGGDRNGMAYGILGLAWVASAQANWIRAARLHGSADTLLERTGARWNDVTARYRIDSLDNVRANLGAEQTDLAHADGMALSLEQVIDLAMGRQPT